MHRSVATGVIFVLTIYGSFSFAGETATAVPVSRTPVIEVRNPAVCVLPVQDGVITCPDVIDVACPGGACWSPLGAIVWFCFDANDRPIVAETTSAGNGDEEVPNYLDAAEGESGYGLTAGSPITCSIKRFCKCTTIVGGVRMCSTSPTRYLDVIVPYTIDFGVSCTSIEMEPLP